MRRADGYVLLDVILALFLFSLGFTAIYGLHEAGIRETQQAFRRLEAANLAQEIMENLAAQNWQDNFATGKIVPGESSEGKRGIFSWQLSSEWASQEVLLKVRVKVRWQEKGNEPFYELQTFYSLY